MEKKHFIKLRILIEKLIIQSLYVFIFDFNAFRKLEDLIRNTYYGEI